MWYESSDLWIFTLSVLIVIGITVNSWIKTYTVNKYQCKSLFSLEVKEKNK